MEFNHVDFRFLEAIPLMFVKKKLKCRKAQTVLRYHQPSPCKSIERYAHHLFIFNPFRQVKQLKSPSVKEFISLGVLNLKLHMLCSAFLYLSV